MQELLSDIYDDESYVGQVKRLFGLYSRFRPQRKEPEIRSTWRHPAVDIPGTRTFAATHRDRATNTAEDVVSETVTVDAHDLFTQLTTLAYLGKREPTRGLLFSIQTVSEGTLRVWREWLSKQCERKTWSDGEPIAVHHDSSSSAAGNAKTRSDSVTGCSNPTEDSSVLWLHTRDNNLGIKFRVRERKWKRTAPILYASDIEVPVSYYIEFEGEFRKLNLLRTITDFMPEVLIRTTHLLLKLEEAQQRIEDQSGKAIVFGSFRER